MHSYYIIIENELSKNRALASVEIPPLPAGVNIQVGWIQVCTDMQFINTYGSEGL